MTRSSSICWRPRTFASAQSWRITNPRAHTPARWSQWTRPSFMAWGRHRYAAVARPGSPLARSIAAQRMDISIFTGVTTSFSKGRRSTLITGRFTAAWAARPGDWGASAIYAHGGYAQAIYSDFVQRNIDAVELLQFGVYRGIELDDWYRILNIGYRFPCVGASDYPACRTLGDCRTYVYLKQEPRLCRVAQGCGGGAKLRHDRSVALAGGGWRTAGGDHSQDRHGATPRSGQSPCQERGRAGSEHQLIVGGKVVFEQAYRPGSGQRQWIELGSRPSS